MIVGSAAITPYARSSNDTGIKEAPAAGTEVGDTQLHWAAFRGHVPSAQQLIDSGADLDEKVASGSTALHMAAYNGHLDIIRLLIENGCDINPVSNDGITPLDWARRNDHAEAEAFLLAHGAVQGKRLPKKPEAVAGQRRSYPGSSLMASSGEYRIPAPQAATSRSALHSAAASAERPQALPEEELIEIPLEIEELEKLESVAKIKQILAQHRAEQPPEQAPGSSTYGEAVQAQGPAPEADDDIAQSGDFAAKRYLIQLAAMSDDEMAESWRLSTIERYAHILAEYQLHVEIYAMPDKQMYRIRSGPLTRGEAASICGQLHLEQQDCLVIRQN